MRPPQLLDFITRHGWRTFRSEQLHGRRFDRVQVNQSLHEMARLGQLQRLKRGLYALPSAQVSEYEIATAVTQPSAVSHASAWHLHGLVETPPDRIHLTRPSSQTRPISSYRTVTVAPEDYFGITRQQHFPITDLERTVLDGFIAPQLCGGMRAVLDALKLHLKRINLSRLVDYAEEVGNPHAQRLGWALDRAGADYMRFCRLSSIPRGGYRPIDPAGPRRGPCDPEWAIQDNLS